MMTREEIKEIEQHYTAHGLTFKQRLNERNIPESNLDYARRMYSREDRYGSIRWGVRTIVSIRDTIPDVADPCHHQTQGKAGAAG